MKTKLPTNSIAAAVHCLQAVERLLDILSIYKRYIPFAGLSLLAGFLAGWIIVH